MTMHPTFPALDAETAQMLRDSVARYGERAGGEAAGRARHVQAAGYDPAHLTVLRDQGWLMMALPEAAGGLGLGLGAAGIVAQGLARAHLAAPFTALHVASAALGRISGGADLLGEMGEGAALPALGWAGTGASFADPTATRVTCDTGGRLSGAVRGIHGAVGASEFLIPARAPGGLVLTRVSADAAVPAIARLAEGTPVGHLALDATPAEVIAEGAEARAALRVALDEGALLAAAELLAHVEAMIDLARAHLLTRQQFGRPIGAFQALQHRMADLFVQQSLARAVLAAAFARIDALEGDEIARGQLVARAKARANDAARLTAREVIQFFGAMGTTEEFGLSLHVKRVLVLAGWLGTSAEQRARFAALEDERARERAEERT